MSVTIDGKGAPVSAGTTLFDAAEAVAVRVPTSCVKKGRCRECLVEIEEGEEHLSPRSPEEASLAPGFRLACRTKLEGEGPVRVHTLRRSAMRIVDETSGLPAFPVEPREGYGLALDVGTTTVSLRLHELTSGRLLATESFENPQRFGGSDVMARIHYDTHHPGRLLQRTLAAYLRHAIERLPVTSDAIVEVVVAGNTTMRDLFFGLDVHSIGQKPYRSTDEGALTTTAQKLRLPFHPDAAVYGPPIVGSHVGADAAAGLLATGLHESEGVSVLMDIGTNTELIVGNRERLVAASCPAGPAFEGGGVRFGMPALEGAIERVALAEDGSVVLGVIGGGEAQGICGSGLVDVLSELLRTGRMNAQGRFEPLALTSRIGITEADVNELAQAKGANVAGLQILSDVYGFRFEALDRLYLAGGFAEHLDLDAARRIGLIPDLPEERIVRVGNAALEGASRLLLAPNARAELEALVRRIEHVELETHPRFFDFFVDGCQFMPVGAEVAS